MSPRPAQWSFSGNVEMIITVCHIMPSCWVLQIVAQVFIVPSWRCAKGRMVRIACARMFDSSGNSDCSGHVRFNCSGHVRFNY